MASPCSSPSDPFNIVDATPFKRDVIKELADACKKQGIHFGVYYSQRQDWNHPGGDVQGGGRWDPTMAGSYEDYLQKVAIPQVKELFTNIKPEVLWWDTQGGTTYAQAKPLHDLFGPGPRHHRRTTASAAASAATPKRPESTIPATGYPDDRDWETCMTINGTWGYKSTDLNFKSTETLLFNFCDIASKGGNYLLNVGPTTEGLIPQPEVDRLMAMGQWMKVNGEAIYGASPNHFRRGGWRQQPDGNQPAGPARFIAAKDWRCTAKAGKIYIIIFKWPAGQMQIPAVKGQITSARLLAGAKTERRKFQPGEHGAFRLMLAAAGNSRPLKFQQTAQTVTIRLPENAPDKIASVLCLQVKGEVAAASAENR